MSTTIRLTRMGRKKRPFYRLIVTDSRNRRDGAYLDNLGYYDPFVEPYEAKLDEESILVWLRKGATLSETARALVQREGILYRWDLERRGVADAEIADKVSAWRSEFAAREASRARDKAAAERASAQEAEAARKAAEEEARRAAEAEAAAEPVVTAEGDAASEPAAEAEPADVETAADETKAED